MFIVIATHDTGHGEVSDPVLMTEDLISAVQIAKNPEQLGYQFYGNEIGCTVYKMEHEKIYSKSDFNCQGRGDPPDMLVFSRIRLNGEWREMWFAFEQSYIAETSRA
ncbi:MAG: hypothetical protein A2568_01840 [Candidatus Yanofskybacteria bacterium RIFOXYD1_FULL_44_17]|uniref:Uncharacterized protein n=1 Tax=Candidatus Yanofskybacteria bacterium GW2011_GWE2_40_11 TaxID=1619033 RepID=A0A0G0TTI1_9BACT|nr:MAG: hypothetical protein UT69_C0039G0002 [Candidatus Yanofskybacteria bacterium GW2011_GWE1_40_10]KKR41187.1 MAG: hypothetical protein UT75_C0001G0091 [Candidatus Yanofskybacteria bacterium GW2011_GWE2_40_11]OGN36209.1 MAG: hypothetical protein A2241_00475 [Candidatus Yanofskybacteria bacterium RIFOXYA2_FULL_45_28]OGN36925.1 MAG: hypothetical protein A2207_01125 [Candidatus Yanofskybacteria bacterium RIFOXYA1_FULL_44_17]OGN38368.1 MAG: hypothetical protein A2405_01395 [Candidatus Yanofskyba